MRRTSIFLAESIEQDLKGIARRRGVPVASVVREALLAYVTSEKEGATALPRFAAVGRSGHRDTAARHEEILFAELAPARGKSAAKKR